MKILTRVALGILFIPLFFSCKSYQSINASKLNFETDLEAVLYQLNKVEPNQMIEVTTHDKNKYEFEYLSHTQDTLRGILNHKLPHNSYKIVKMDMKLGVNSIAEVKTEKINYLLTGAPIVLFVGVMIYLVNNITFSYAWGS